MEANQLVTLLQRYTPETLEEKAFKPIILDFLSTSEHCFSRSHCCGHITASCWLLNKNRDQALLMHHAKLDRWLQLGGHCDGETDTLAVALREAQEESGIKQITALSSDIFDIDIHWIPSNSREKGHYHYDIRYLLGVDSDEEFIQNSESKKLQWVGLKDSLPTSHTSVGRMFHKWARMMGA